jgi:hypothetical protein
MSPVALQGADKTRRRRGSVVRVWGKIVGSYSAKALSKNGQRGSRRRHDGESQSATRPSTKMHAGARRAPPIAANKSSSIGFSQLTRHDHCGHSRVGWGEGEAGANKATGLGLNRDATQAQRWHGKRRRVRMLMKACDKTPRVLSRIVAEVLAWSL